MAKNFKHIILENALLDARLESSLTQIEVATKLQKPQSFVSKYESGERRLDVIEFIEVCDALAVQPISIIKKITKDD